MTSWQRLCAMDREGWTRICAGTELSLKQLARQPRPCLAKVHEESRMTLLRGSDGALREAVGRAGLPSTPLLPSNWVPRCSAETIPSLLGLTVLLHRPF